MLTGCAAVFTQLGVTITGSRSTSARISSNEALPEPITMEARNSMTGMPLARRILPVAMRLLMCGDSASPCVNPPR